MPDDITRQFLWALCGDAAAAVCFQTFDDDKERKDRDLARTLHGSIDDLEGQLRALNDRRAGVYVTVNAVAPGARRLIEHVTALRACFIDVDGTAELPTRWPALPSIIVQRDATHWHAYWLLETGQPVERFSPMQAWLAAYFGSDTEVGDLPRVMRLPGFMHHKGEPQALTLVDAEPSRVYAIDALIEAHPIDWSAVDDKHVRKGATAGISPAHAEQERRADAQRKRRLEQRSHSKPRNSISDDREAQIFRNWCATIDATEGPANANGGRNKALFKIAAEGFARGLDAEIVRAEAMDYAARAGMPENEADRTFASALSYAEGHTLKANRPQNVGQGRPRGCDAPQPPARRDVAPAAAADDEAGDQAEQEPASAYDGLDLRALGTRWMIAPDGAVVPMEYSSQAGAFVPRGNKRVAGLPIWPVRQGIDVVSRDPYWLIAWRCPRGHRREQWMPEPEMKSGDRLVDLPEGPVAKRRAADCATWLTEARVAVTAEPCEVISRVGWCGINGSRRWVWPGVGREQGVEYIGEDIDTHGEREQWLSGLRALVALPDDQANVAMASLCISAAAPWSRLLGARNPILGLMCRSSSGKGSAIDYALSIWSLPDRLRLPASSTAKGIQDRAITMADCPVFLDELQQLAEYSQQQAADALYFLANGQRRTTSSRQQTAVGGERRHGVGFYAAEAPILPGLNLGVQYRVVELDGQPCPTRDIAIALQRATKHGGTMAGAISEILHGRSVDEWTEHLTALQDAYRPGGEIAADNPIYGDLRGDDAATLALVHQGSDALQQASGLLWDTEALTAWLAAEMRRQRRDTVDRETVALMAILSALLNQDWRADATDARERRVVITIQQRPLAWRRWPDDQSEGYIDCDPEHPSVSPLFREYGGRSRVLKAWADRGWIVCQGAHRTVRRRGAGHVVRLLPTALEQLGESMP